MWNAIENICLRCLRVIFNKQSALWGLHLSSLYGFLNWIFEEELCKNLLEKLSCIFFTSTSTLLFMTNLCLQTVFGYLWVSFLSIFYAYRFERRIIKNFRKLIFIRSSISSNHQIVSFRPICQDTEFSDYIILHHNHCWW